MSTETVYVLTVEHRHGTNVSVHLTRAGAQQGLYDYVADSWGDECDRWDDEEIPSDPDTAVKVYFDNMHDEYAVITESALFP